MPHDLTRRQFLGAAGGVTFLALTAVRRGLFAATEPAGGARLPFFTAVPYIQPGNNSRLLPGRESILLAWQTENKPADFEVHFGLSPRCERKARVSLERRYTLDSNIRLNYSSSCDHLPLGQKMFYRIEGNGMPVAEGYCTTRQPRGQRIRFAALGDSACSSESNLAIAYQIYNSNPDFVMNTGDNVYERGLDHEYSKYFFMVYNADHPAIDRGAPLLRSVPYYTVLANHDVHRSDAQHHDIADFDQDPGSLAYYTSMYLPQNGPVPTCVTPITGSPQSTASFKQCAGTRFPRMANYSFDYGDAHFLCLDSNLYVDPTELALQNWIESDLRSTDAEWKFVVFHHPGFDVGKTHFTEQHMRVLSPLFERTGVDVVLSGHEHSYQRTRPLHFAPTDTSRASNRHESDRRVPGTFTIDRDFDGVTQTRPKGIIYLVTGAGGKDLYGGNMTDNPATWLHARDNHADYLSRFVSDRHSFTRFEVDGAQLTWTQIDANGQAFDKVRVTKA